MINKNIGWIEVNIIKVDFKSKKKIEKYEVRSWLCGVCFRDFKYDSRKDKRAPLLVRIRNDYYCASCIKAMNDLVEKMEKESGE